MKYLHLTQNIPILGKNFRVGILTYVKTPCIKGLLGPTLRYVVT